MRGKRFSNTNCAASPRATRASTAIAAAMFAVACGQSSLPMEPGAPLTLHRGYCLVEPEFLQAQRERNRDDTLETLSTYDDVEPHVATGRALRVGSRVASVLAGSAMGIGILGAGGTIEMSRGASTALIVSGAAVAVLSIGVCVVGEGQYATAVDVYNERISRSGGADQDRTDKPDPADALEKPEPKEEPKTYRRP